MSDAEIEVTPEEAARAAADGAQVVDVREPYEREAGHLPGSLHIELPDLAAGAARLDRERPVIFYCRAGARSLMAAQAFRQAGFDARSMSGGVLQWAGEGRPLAPEGGHVADH
jgi:rhodanese-related sulfurtransferase